MRALITSVGLTTAAALVSCSTAQPGENLPGSGVRADLYQCDGCEAVFDTDLGVLSATARIGPENEPGETLKLTGTVYQADGETPAVGVVIYAYQTNAAGRYANGTDKSQWSRRHGRLRGWVKTDETGRYLFETIKPAPYPNDLLPAHVHFTILEADRPPYWIDDIVFESEFGVTQAYRQQMTNKGGNGIVPLVRTEDGSLKAVRDITLERHPDLQEETQ